MKNHLKTVIDSEKKLRITRDILSSPISSIIKTTPDPVSARKSTDMHVNRTDKHAYSMPNPDTAEKHRNESTLNKNQNTQSSSELNYKSVYNESLQNKRILETTVILTELLREIQGAVFATKKLKFSLFSAHDYSKSVNMSGDITGGTIHGNQNDHIFEMESWEYEDDDDDLEVLKSVDNDEMLEIESWVYNIDLDV